MVASRSNDEVVASVGAGRGFQPLLGRRRLHHASVVRASMLPNAKSDGTESTGRRTKRPIREADIRLQRNICRCGPNPDMAQRSWLKTQPLIAFKFRPLVASLQTSLGTNFRANASAAST